MNRKPRRRPLQQRIQEKIQEKKDHLKDTRGNLFKLGTAFVSFILLLLWLLFRLHTALKSPSGGSLHTEPLADIPRDRESHIKAEGSCHSEGCCLRDNPITSPYKIATASFKRKTFRMAVHDDTSSEVSDIVSRYISRNGGWETRIAERLFDFVRPPPSNTRAKKENGPLIVDVGANVGFLTFAMASWGIKTLSFEPFPHNLALLRLSLCMNPTLARHVTLLPYALHTKQQQCELWQSPHINFGDTYLICPDDGQVATAAVGRSEGDVQLATVETRALDDLIREGEVRVLPDHRIGIKIDIEGFEPFAMKGAMEFMQQHKPGMGVTEFTPDLIEKAMPNGALTYLNLLTQLGYSIEGEGILSQKRTKALLSSHGGELVFTRDE